MGLATWSFFFGLGLTAILYHVWRASASSLSKIPNAGFGAAYSRLAWAFPHEYRGTITIDLPQMHEKLGPLIRIGPNEVSYYSRDTYETVHKVGSKFRKDPRVYGEFVQGDHPALFSLTNPDEHSKRRRMMGQLFNRSKVSQSERLVTSHVDHFISRLRSKEGAVNLTTACRALEADIISELSFGKSINSIDHWAKGQEVAMVAKNDEKATWMPVLITFPVLCEMWESLERGVFAIAGLRTSYSQGLAEFQDWCREAWNLALTDDSRAQKTTVESPNLVRTLCNAGLPAETALSEAKENLGPGTDTTSATLAHILFALAQNGRYQEALFQDLAAVGFPTDMQLLESIPRLLASVKEGIRWAGAAAAMLPRIVPSGGIKLHDTFIPENTVLTSSPIWYLHDKTAFPVPQLYDPYRWLTRDGGKMSEDPLRDKFYIPFSRGANICMGAHFAYLELLITVSQVIRHFVILPEPHPTETHEALKEERASQGWNPVSLPKRQEWVAAVPLENLQVKLRFRT